MTAAAMLYALGGLVALVGVGIAAHMIEEGRRRRRLYNRHPGTFRDFIKRNDKP